MSLGERIYKFRTEKELSQGDLAEALEVSRQSISKWETNGSVPELDKLVRLSEVFGVSLDALVTGKEDAERPAAQEAEPQVIYIEKPVKQKSTAAQKWCIVLCSLVCVLLLTNLASIFLLPDGEPEDQPSSGPVQQELQNYEISASDVQSVQIEWNGGHVRLVTGDTDKIIVAGTDNAELIGDMLKIQPGADSGNDLVITVPGDWTCPKLTLQCAGTTIDLQHLSVSTLELNGSDCVWTVSGDIETINTTGNRSNLDLTLPKDCGFQVELDWAHSTFHSDFSGVRFYGGKYLYGDAYCKIKVDGLSWVVFVNQTK